MDARTILFASCLAAAAVSVTVGAAVVHGAAGWVVGGILGAGWSWLILGDAS